MHNDVLYLANVSFQRNGDGCLKAANSESIILALKEPLGIVRDIFESISNQIAKCVYDFSAKRTFDS